MSAVHISPVLVRKTWPGGTSSLVFKRASIKETGEQLLGKCDCWGSGTIATLIYAHIYTHTHTIYFSILQSWSKAENEEDVERMNETNPLKTVEYLWDYPKSFSITVVGCVLSLTTVVGWKPNQTKIKMNDSKIKQMLYSWLKTVAKTINISTEQIWNLTNQTAR